MKTSIGVDTLHLNPVEWQLAEHFTAGLTLGELDSASGEFSGHYPIYTVGGRTFEGRRALLSLHSCTLEFNPHSDRETGTARVSTKITMTVPKVLWGDNFNPADRESLQGALNIVQNDLDVAGFRCDIGASLVKRLDMARTIHNRSKWLTYRPVLEVFSPSRMSGVGFETGKRWGNTRRQICVYDKVEEAASKVPRKQRPEVFARYPANSMRAELRLTERESVQAATGMQTANDVLSDFGHVQSVYKREFESKLFKFKPSEVEKMVAEVWDVDTIAAEMAPFIAQGGQWLEAWIKADWAANRVQTDKKLAVVKAAVKVASDQAGLASQNVFKQAGRLDTLFLESGQAVKGRSLGDLYRELESGILDD